MTNKIFSALSNIEIHPAESVSASHLRQGIFELIKKKTILILIKTVISLLMNSINIDVIT